MLVGGLARITVVKAVDVGQDQRLGTREVGDERGQAVVIAEADLVGGDGIVLVDHRHGAQRPQPIQGPLRIRVVRAPGDVVRGEQHLADHATVAPERGSPRMGQRQLSDNGRGLLGREVGGSAAQTQRRESGTDRTRGHDDHVAARSHPLFQCVGEAVEALDVETVVQIGDRRGNRS